MTDVKVVHIRLNSDTLNDLDAALNGFRTYIDSGVAPEGSDIVVEDYETFTARGRVEDCDCELIECVCIAARSHTTACRFRLALTCAIPVACEDHERDVCALCDSCDCSSPLHGK